MNTMTVKPADGLLVRNPERGFRPLDPAGEAVPLNEYWIRRLQDGDVIKVAASEAGKATTSSKK